MSKLFHRWISETFSLEWHGEWQENLDHICFYVLAASWRERRKPPLPIHQSIFLNAHCSTAQNEQERSPALHLSLQVHFLSQLKYLSWKRQSFSPLLTTFLIASSNSDVANRPALDMDSFSILYGEISCSLRETIIQTSGHLFPYQGCGF